ncbi:class I SAM-dependent methyltransferase [Falsibacillus pallidus]|uniref:Site-specific DNA-methyltransferase (Adenine-specific) n=1 Tax=Falsibacillus pallidus TaxID=493781 RepID=A0A370GKM5_9BACI|nr:class I SAM-dependent methyltransferase [Falsibacillus pallidus]RDI44275.1 site-specific DNA-methyltransferase (adenine-specific) [Falsibacillus pallidus]
MITSPVESLFQVFNETAELLAEELSCTYLEALAETGENIFHGSILQEEVSELGEKRLKKLYSSIHIEGLGKEDIRKAYQLAIIKGMREASQPNHQMTPDSIGLFLSYLIGKFMNGKKEFSLLDPAVGTGNLQFTIMNQLHDKTIQSFGVDVDDVLIRLAFSGANLIRQPLELFNQDALEPLFIDPVDCVVCDLPVGFYPNDVRAMEYKLKADKGHSYAHHLFIEQSVNHAKEGAYLFFLVPNGIFESEEAPKLREYIKDNVNIQGLVQLPMSLFKNEAAAKSIFVLQKKGEEIKAPKQGLMVKLPKLSNQKAMEDIFGKIDEWFEENK